MNQHHYGVIMAGGVGSRFWPMSRKRKPKQFIDIFDSGHSLIQQTYARLLKHCLPDNIFVVTSEDYRGLVKEHLPQMKNENILGEPHARNTAPCIAYAAYKIYTRDPQASMVVMPSDHIIGEEEKFQKVIERGFGFVDKHPYLLTLGIAPTRPDTGYGYIQFVEDDSIDGINRVKTFTEKPNEELAEHFYKSGEFFWNAGIFLWKASAIIKEFEQHQPDTAELFERAKADYFTETEPEAMETLYQMCSSISIDYAILEKTSNVYVLPADFAWSDVGTWQAMYELGSKDENGNVVHGTNVLLRGVENSIINVTSPILVAVNGLSDIIVIEADGVVLIAHRHKEQEIRQVVNEVKIKWGEKFA